MEAREDLQWRRETPGIWVIGEPLAALRNAFDGMDSSRDLVGIDVPKSPLAR